MVASRRATQSSLVPTRPGLDLLRIRFMDEVISGRQEGELAEYPKNRSPWDIYVVERIASIHSALKLRATDCAGPQVKQTYIRGLISPSRPRFNGWCLLLLPNSASGFSWEEGRSHGC